MTLEHISELYWVWSIGNTEMSPRFDNETKARKWYKDLCQHFHQFKCEK